jgi:DNA repair protein RadC
MTQRRARSGLAEGDGLFDLDPPPSDPVSGAEGHRARMRARLLSAGPEALADHEMLALPGHFRIRRRPEPVLALRASDGLDEMREQPRDDGAPDGG